MKLHPTLLFLLATLAPAQTIHSLDFLTGVWTNTTPTTYEEETWSRTSGDSIVGTYRVVENGTAVFYEFWAVELESGHPVFKMKHFNQGLAGWEQKDESVTLPVTHASPNDVTFANPDGTLTLRYQRTGGDLTSTLTRLKNGTPKVDVFHLHRLANSQQPRADSQ